MANFTANNSIVSCFFFARIMEPRAQFKCVNRIYHIWKLVTFCARCARASTIKLNRWHFRRNRKLNAQMVCQSATFGENYTQTAMQLCASCCSIIEMETEIANKWNGLFDCGTYFFSQQFDTYLIGVSMIEWPFASLAMRIKEHQAIDWNINFVYCKIASISFQHTNRSFRCFCW